MSLHFLSFCSPPCQFSPVPAICSFLFRECFSHFCYGNLRNIFRSLILNVWYFGVNHFFPLFEEFHIKCFKCFKNVPFVSSYGTFSVQDLIHVLFHFWELLSKNFHASVILYDSGNRFWVESANASPASYWDLFVKLAESLIIFTILIFVCFFYDLFGKGAKLFFLVFLSWYSFLSSFNYRSVQVFIGSFKFP